jgi:multidrug resistance efflux pump
MSETQTQEQTVDERLKAANKNLREAEKTLKDLRTEQAGLPAAIEEAATSGADVFELTRKLDEMPARLFAAEVEVHRARIAVAQATLDQAAEARSKAEKAILERGESHGEELKAARAQLDELEREWSGLQIRVDATQRWTVGAGFELRQAKDGLQNLLRTRIGQAATKPA